MLEIDAISAITKDLCTAKELELAEQSIKNRVPALFKLLPPDHAWQKKFEHMIAMTNATRSVLETIESAMSEVNYRLFLLIFGVHDIGRIPEGLKGLGQPLLGYENFSNHGVASVMLLDQWGILGIFSSETQRIISYAIKQHVAPVSPSLPQNQTSKDVTADILALLIRDFDKLKIFSELKNGYLRDKAIKRQQIRINGFSGEKYFIDPPASLKVFQQEKMPQPNPGISFEAYRLCLLACIFDINFQSIFKEIMKTGIVTELLSYFSEQLSAEEYSTIKQTVVNFLKKSGLPLNI